MERGVRFRRSSLSEQLVPCSSLHMSLYVCCDVSQWTPQSEFKNTKFGHAEQSGAAVATMVVIVTADENSCCLLLSRHFE